MTTSTRVWDIGDAPAVRAEFRDADNVLTTPSTRSCTLRTPDGTETAVDGTGTVVSVGIVDFQLPAFTVGDTHYVRIKGSGGIQAVASELTLQVRKSAFTNP